MSPFRTSLFWRLLVWFFVVNLLVLVLGGFLTRRLIEYTTEVEINWVSLAQGANEAFDRGGQSGLEKWRNDQRQDGIDATLYENGNALVPMRLPPTVRASLPEWLASGHELVTQPYPRLYLAVQNVTGADGKPRQLVALSRTHVRLAPQARQQIFLAIQFGLSLVMIGFVGWWVARSVARPVEALRDAARRITAGELSARVGPRGQKGPGELSALSGDFDAMAERIEALVAHDRAVLQDLSHELRSPLARLQLILDLAQRSRGDVSAPYFLQAEQEIERIDRMTGEMLALSRLEAGIPGLERDKVLLADVVRECVERAELDASAHQVQVKIDLDESVQVFGNVPLLERAVGNLLANAIKFSPKQGVVDVIVRKAGGRAEVSVKDQGPGVPEGELEQLFRPFFRGSNAARAEGHGLGLAIVRRVAQVHDGDIIASNMADSGLAVRLNLPLA
ncbi:MULTISPECIES: sensor histidine kinase [Dyella]|uniref:histidine kinase n=2 Tax=Dyella TaxID=231454 RepID=A0A4V2NMI9_9GAMM|nr:MULTISPECIES: HAMP domain-containing sensor histidine kinase [Dyella]TBR38912.1 HAMP domain-containing histidine kinase [Dyella terrae]TCI13497.1 HAMP domain-containing histidine kinase [Dyella soli]